MRKRLASVFARHFTTLVDVAGAGLIVAGVALIFVPAAFIVAGVALLAISWNISRTGASS